MEDQGHSNIFWQRHASKWLAIKDHLVLGYYAPIIAWFL